MRNIVFALGGVWEFERVLIGLTFAAGCFFHFLNIDSLPMGFYVDESSIGYNAYLIASTGADEHGVHWPLFFEAFGEYKNPLYIYLLAALYKVLGYSEWTTRCLSALCWLGGSMCLYELMKTVSRDNNLRLYGAIALSFTPWVFALSRVSFEVIVLYPLLSLYLLAIYRGFERTSRSWSAVAGMTIGLCLYAYSTLRLLTPLYCAAVIICYRATKFRRSILPFILGAAVSAAPYALYAVYHFDTLVRRFDRHFGSLTYINDPTLSIFEKLNDFVTLYVGYLGLPFLGLTGDPNRRHHAGFCGELLLATLLLLALSTWKTLMRRDDLFRTYLLIGLLLSPVAAALTVDPHHSLRAFSMSVFAILLSAYGLEDLPRVIARFLVGFSALCACFYVFYYFIVYPPQSAIAFENYGFRSALQEALADTPKRVVLSSEGNVPYINLLFFGSLEHAHIPLVVGTRSDSRPGDVFIAYDPSQGPYDLYHVDRAPTDTGLSQ